MKYIIRLTMLCSSNNIDFVQKKLDVFTIPTLRWVCFGTPSISYIAAPHMSPPRLPSSAHSLLPHFPSPINAEGPGILVLPEKFLKYQTPVGAF